MEDEIALSDSRAYFSFGLFVVNVIVHDVRTMPLSAILANLL